MDIFNIFKRTKPKHIMPQPNFESNWMQDIFQKNIEQGVRSLQNGKEIHIMDDGRGYELALEIKNRFILEYQKQLSEKIEIINGSKLIVRFKK